MKATCDLCEKIQKKTDVIYEDDKVVAILEDKPASAGHIILMPKDHFPIIETVPDFILGHMFTVANKLSVMAFEKLGAEGTNLLVQNGLSAGQHNAHFLVNIIPRRLGDGLDLSWNPKELPDSEAGKLEILIKQGASNVGGFEKEKTKPVELDEQPEQEEGDEETNYMIRQLRRIP